MLKMPQQIIGLNVSFPDELGIARVGTVIKCEANEDHILCTDGVVRISDGSNLFIWHDPLPIHEKDDHEINVT